MRSIDLVVVAKAQVVVAKAGDRYQQQISSQQGMAADWLEGARNSWSWYALVDDAEHDVDRSCGGCPH